MSHHPDHRDYVLQDSRSNLGDYALFWARDGHGYTTDLNQAHRFTETEALAQNRARPTDIPHRLNDLKPAAQEVIEAERLKRVTQNKVAKLIRELKSIEQALDGTPDAKEYQAIIERCEQAQHALQAEAIAYPDATRIPKGTPVISNLYDIEEGLDALDLDARDTPTISKPLNARRMPLCPTT